MPETPYETIVGLEVHVELNTQTKMFCRCLNDPFVSEPNVNICPVCVALPGTLPVPNREAILKALRVGKALGSTNPAISRFDRKHYFYPDLPKGYQISQFDLPFCIGGSVELLDKEGNVESAVRLERVHLEEDAGKLMHTGKQGQSRVDLNRAGVPLIEMVSKPDMRSAEQARRFLQEIRLLMRTLGVSDADMEKGQMRCDVNISVRFTHEGEQVWTPVTEVKNVNSSRAVERSIRTESQRLYEEWIAGGEVRTRKHKITVGWDEDRNSINLQRAKEAASDYRYFPEPDIPPINVEELLRAHPDVLILPELPNAKRLRYLRLGLQPADVEVFVNDGVRAGRLESLIENGLPPKTVANWLLNAEASMSFSNAQFSDLLSLTEAGEASFAAVKPRMAELQELLASEASLTVRDALAKLGLLQVHDESVLQSAVAEVLAANPDVVREYKEGKEKVIGFLVGQVMKKTAGKAQPPKIQAALTEALKSL